MAKDKIAMKYKGNGFFVNVPARDLSADEVQRFGREFLLSLGLYEEVETPKPKTKPKAKIVNKAMTPLEAEWHEEDELWQQE
jgi:hypothetical protein